MPKQTMFRQGDVLLLPVSAIPAAATPRPATNGLLTLAYGEKTGHHHSIAASPSVALLDVPMDGQVEAQVWDQVGAQVWTQVGAQVEAQVRAQVAAKSPAHGESSGSGRSTGSTRRGGSRTMTSFAAPALPPRLRRWTACCKSLVMRAGGGRSRML